MKLPTIEGTRVKVATWSSLEDRSPAYALVAGVDLVVIRYDDRVSVMYGRCHHRGALLANGSIDGPNLICGVHGWDYRYDTGVSEYNHDEALHRFEEAQPPSHTGGKSTWGRTKTCTARPTSRSTRTSSPWPGTGWHAWDTTAPFPRWGCRSPTFRGGSTSSFSPLNSRPDL